MAASASLCQHCASSTLRSGVGSRRNAIQVGATSSAAPSSLFFGSRLGSGLRVGGRGHGKKTVTMVASPLRQEEEFPSLKPFSAADPPPFTLKDIRDAIPKQCWEKNVWKSMGYLARDVAVVLGLAAAAAYLDSWLVWPLYWFAQGTMFWALFVIGHDCGHGSFSNNKALNDFVGHMTHASILVPYHGWRISHRTHHGNHGHVENDESWHPISKSTYDSLEFWAKVGRLTTPWALFAYPFYLWKRSPGKDGSHFDPSCDLFHPNEEKDVITSRNWYFSMLALLAGLSFAIGPLMVFNLYVVPYWFNVVWLDVVTYLHHHGYDEKVPWYRGEEWNYMRGGLSTIDRDYGVFNNIHHDIGTHVVHHLFPQIPHYNLIEATEAVKPVLGPYYREPEKSPSWFPSHLVGALLKSFREDHYVEDEGDVVFYKTDKSLLK